MWLDLDGEHVIAIVGKRGSGKTHTLGVVAEGLSITSQPSTIDAGFRHAVVIFDTLNLFQWVDLPLSEAKGPQAVRQNLTVRGNLNYVLSNLKSADPSQISLNSRNVNIADSVRLLEPGQGMISAVESPRLVFCDIRPRLTVHGGFEG